MSWHCSQERAEGFSLQAYLDSVPSARWKSHHTLGKFCCNGSGTESCRSSRFGMTSATSMPLHGTDTLTLYQGDFPVRTSARPAKEPDFPANVPAYGTKCGELFAKYDRHSHLWKIAPCLQPEDSTGYSGKWPKAGMMLRGWCWEQPTLGLRTCGNASGFSPWIPNGCTFFHTPTTNGLDGGSNSRRALRQRLLPTPKSHDANETACTSNLNRKSPGLGTLAAAGVLGRRGRLNPAFVEWLMGWPIGWTALNPLEMGKFRLWRQQHSYAFMTNFNNTFNYNSPQHNEQPR